MVIVIMVCMLVVITASVWVVIMENCVHVLIRKLFSASDECRLIHYNLPFKTGINELQKPQINGAVC